MAKYHKYNYLPNTTCYLPQMPVAMQSPARNTKYRLSINTVPIQQYQYCTTIFSKIPHKPYIQTVLKKLVTYFLTGKAVN